MLTHAATMQGKKEVARLTIREFAARGNEKYSAGEYEKAIELYKKVLQSAVEISDKHVIVRLLINIGNAFSQQQKLTQAMEVFSMALQVANLAFEALQSDDIDEGKAIDKEIEWLVQSSCYNGGQDDEQCENNDKQKEAKVTSACEGDLEEGSLRIKQELFVGKDNDNRAVAVVTTEAIENVLVEISKVLNGMGMTCERDGRYLAAIATYEESLQLRRTVLGYHHESVVESLFSLGSCYEKMNQFDSAVECFVNALEVHRKLPHCTSSDRSEVLNIIARVHICKGDFKKAMQTCSEALTAVLEESEDIDHCKLAAVLSTMGLINESLGNLNAALKCYSEVLDITKSKVLTIDDLCLFT